MNGLRIFENTPALQIESKKDDITNAIINNYDVLLNKLDTSEASIKTYTQNATNFITYLTNNSINIDTLLFYKRYVLTIVNRKASTKQAYINSARAILKQAYKFGLLPTDITIGIKGIKKDDDKVKDGVTLDEAAKVANYINSIENNCKKAELAAIFYLGAFQGLRINEISTLRIENVDLRKGTVLVNAKGRDELVRIDLHPLTNEALNVMLDCKGAKEGSLFSRKWKGQDKQLTNRAIQKKFALIFGKLDIKNSMHGFRHFYITTVLDALGGDILQAQKLSRHKSTSMLKVYDDRRNTKAINAKVFEAFTLNFSK